ncbi:hypothetical protein CDOO_12605 [Corynebacterium doosanense CAU 212 = DSM 45436]|uniref:DUF732 domain-containing protein n=1 Tax=Corynebacterium doosanense CAU 212 = DSM 45436 TaxID=558173 RepID=A0A097IIP8_9CORY|nr:hypothetical protein CDOO_12605 [Corynebacterium doosanense CAU 212 = DSM 45436]
MTVAYRRLAGALVLTGALALTACGGSTVTSDDVDSSSTSVAPLDRGSSSASSSPSTSSSRAASSSAQPQDEGAREISSIPSAEPAVDPTQEKYISGLAEDGINVEGIEAQLVGTAQTVCSDDPLASVTAGAVAGQLIEQGRTDRPVEEVTRAIETSARDNYCA